jgi:hypothetical protein
MKTTYFLMKTRFNRFLKVIGIQKKLPISFGEKKQEMKGYKFISHYTKFITLLHMKSKLKVEKNNREKGITNLRIYQY